MKLVIVESPTKAKTISRFLTRDFRVEASYGHVRDLPKTKFGVGEENDFTPTYVVIPKAAKRLKELEKIAAKAEALILATDEDREGEAIAWHLSEALGLGKPKSQVTKSKHALRIVFHEITKNAIEEALKNPRDIDMKLVLAQQARRILDRIVGYKLSPFLWKKVMRGLSAGRVQSVAVRLIVEREREIEKFQPQEYWTISALLQKERDKRAEPFMARLASIDKKPVGKFDTQNETQAQEITKDLDNREWRVERIEKKELRRSPSPPFITSSLVAEASRRFGFSAKQTMFLAQQLYEGVELGREGNIGLITYVRTDSTNLAEEAIEKIRTHIKKESGQNYLVPTPRRYKTRSRLAQEAHEAIRPTEPERAPVEVKSYLDPRQFKLYDLIWRRTIATQMNQAVFEATSVDVAAEQRGTIRGTTQKKYIFRATGSVMRFDGFLKVYPIKTEEVLLPALKEDEPLELLELKPEQHFTEPPPRYSEATLVKTLEQYGIGRPSTYAPIISTIQDRAYVEKGPDRKFRPSDVGRLVNDLLVEHFPEVVDFEFTAKMEEELDDIAEGKTEWVPVVREFYEPFMTNLKKKESSLTRRELTEQATDEACPECAKPLVIKFGKYGRFIACTGYPECTYTRKINQNNTVSLGLPCPECGAGEIVERRTKKRWRVFYGCSRYPGCTYATWQDPRTGEVEKVL